MKTFRPHFPKNGFLRFLAGRFSYSIFYKKITEEIIIFRILDYRRNPEWIASQLKCE